MQNDFQKGQQTKAADTTIQLTVSKKGDYIEEKWIRKRKEFIKIHIAADAKSKKVASFRVTTGNVHDAKKFCPLEKHLRVNQALIYLSQKDVVATNVFVAIRESLEVYIDELSGRFLVFVYGVINVLHLPVY
jgi:hypothetical protein